MANYKPNAAVETPPSRCWWSEYGRRLTSMYKTNRDIYNLQDLQEVGHIHQHYSP
ncbi:unnamed protein product [Arabidopsis halleri]